MTTSSTTGGAGGLSHEEARGLLDAWHEGELEQSEAARVEAHVRTCERCQRTEAALGGGLKMAIRAVHEAEPKVDLLPGVQRRLHLRSRGKFYRQSARSYSAWPMFFASVLVLGVLVLVYVLQMWVSRDLR